MTLNKKFTHKGIHDEILRVLLDSCTTKQCEAANAGRHLLYSNAEAVASSG